MWSAHHVYFFNEKREQDSVPWWVLCMWQGACTSGSPSLLLPSQQRTCWSWTHPVLASGAYLKQKRRRRAKVTSGSSCPPSLCRGWVEDSGWGWCSSFELEAKTTDVGARWAERATAAGRCGSETLLQSWGGSCGGGWLCGRKQRVRNGGGGRGWLGPEGPDWACGCSAGCPCGSCRAQSPWPGASGH